MTPLAALAALAAFIPRDSSFQQPRLRPPRKGWLISLDDPNKYRWAVSYALGIEEITGLPDVSQLANAANGVNAAPVLLEGAL